MPAVKPEVFSLPRLLLCEGAEDSWFFRSLIDTRRIKNYHIADTSHESNRRGGKSQFGRKLNALRTSRPSFRQISHVLIVSDNDDSQQDNFAALCRQLADNGFAAPGAPLVPTGGRPSIAIMMLPLDPVVGNLESTCIEATRSTDQAIAGHVDFFCASVRADDWRDDKKAKLWIRAMLSARNEPDPFIPLGRAFDQGMVPMLHQSFDPIANFLAGFGP